MARTVDYEGFALALKASGWSAARLCKQLGLHPNTASRWAKTGQAPIYAAEYLRLVNRLRGAAAGLG